MTTVTERPGTIDPTHVRDVMSMVPTSVTVVAGQPELTGERAAMIVGSFVFISLDPCLVGFFVGHESSTWPQLNKATVLGISTLGSGQTGFCRKLGSGQTRLLPQAGQKGSRPLRRTASGPREHTVPHWSQAPLQPWNAKSRTLPHRGPRLRLDRVPMPQHRQPHRPPRLPKPRIHSHPPLLKPAEPSGRLHARRNRPLFPVLGLH